jgi:hypothetical protein
MVSGVEAPGEARPNSAMYHGTVSSDWTVFDFPFSRAEALPSPNYLDI